MAKFLISLGIAILIIITIVLYTSQKSKYKIFSTDQDYKIFSAEYDISDMLKDSGRFTPTDKDIQEVGILLKKFLNTSNELDDISGYKAQFIGYLNGNGERMIRGNYFCDTKDLPWRKELVFILDGGKCFFTVNINLDTKKVSDLSVNGDA